MLTLRLVTVRCRGEFLLMDGELHGAAYASCGIGRNHVKLNEVGQA